MEHEAFYAAAVQVIPVLFLVLAFEARQFRLEGLPDEWEDRVHIEGWSEEDTPKVRRLVLRWVRWYAVMEYIWRAVSVSLAVAAEALGFLALVSKDEPPKWFATVIFLAILVLLFQIFLVAISLPDRSAVK